MKRKIAVACLFVTLVAVFLIPISVISATPKEVVKMKYTTYLWPEASYEEAASLLWQYVEKNSNGRIKISKFYSQSLNKVPEILPAVSKGVAELGLIGFGYYPSEFPLSRGLEWYYRGVHADTMFYVMRDLMVQFPQLREEWEVKNNLKVLCFLNGSYSPFFMRKPMPTLNDMKGKKIRAYGIGADTLARLGAISVPVTAPEILPALQRGVLDGVFASCFISIVPQRFQREAPYIVETGSGVHAPIPVCMNMDVWKSLDPELKAVFEAGIKELYDHAYVDLYNKLMVKYVDLAVQDGAKFSIWSPEDMAKAKALIQPAQVDKWVKEVCQLPPADCSKMQALIDQLVAKYEPNAKMKVPYEVYLEKYGQKAGKGPNR